MQVVLQRRARDQQPEVRVEQAHDRRELRLLVLDAVRLVDDQILPHKLLNRSLLLQDGLIGGEAHVEGIRRLEVLLAQRLAALAVALQLEDLERRAPTRALVRPVRKRRLGRDDQVRAGDLARLLEVTQERDGLQRLAKPHLIRKDPVDPLLVQLDQPVQALELVRAHLAKGDARRLHREARALGRARRIARGRGAQKRLVLRLLGQPPFATAPLTAARGGGGGGCCLGLALGGLGCGRSLDEMGEYVRLFHQVGDPLLRRLRTARLERALLLFAHLFEHLRSLLPALVPLPLELALGRQRRRGRRGARGGVDAVRRGRHEEQGEPECPRNLTIRRKRIL